MPAAPTPRSAATDGVDAVLSVRDLRVELHTAAGRLCAVDGVSLDVRPSQTVALVGESGCGKTMTALAVLGLLPRSTANVSGTIRFDGQEIQGWPARRLRHIRGAGISMVFQEPVAALNPVFTIGDQISSVLRAHDGLSKREARERAVELLTAVGVPEAAARLRDYPHQWSGGMCQRAMIAMAIANGPRLVIADEPTTALDVTVQAQVLEVLRQAQRATGAATLLITHDLGVVAELADEVAVMYAGRLVETAPVRHLFDDPRHPYTRALLACLPRLDRRVTLDAIPGQPPLLHRVPPGCPFHPRCGHSHGRAECAAIVPALELAGPSGRRSACHFHDELPPMDDAQSDGRPWAKAAPAAAPASDGDNDPILTVEDLVVHFPVRSGALGRVTGHIRAVDGITLSLRPGETLGLVGESGCGKSTTAGAIVRLVDATAGRVVFAGNDLARFSRRQLRDVRRGMQMVFQDPHSSVNPKMKIGDTIAEPLRIHGTRPAEVRRRVRELLEMVGLDQVHAARFPHQLSGGQLQRVGIARALALDPQVLVLDEPVSALDVSIQAQVLSLLADLQRRLSLAYLFISHDLSVIRQICDRVAVMYLGRIVESGPIDTLYGAPQHPYTASLLEAVPRPDPSARPERRRMLLDDLPPAADLPTGCRFRSRCWRGDDRCATDPPTVVVGGVVVACHYPGELATPVEVVSRGG